MASFLIDSSPKPAFDYCSRGVRRPLPCLAGLRHHEAVSLAADWMVEVLQRPLLCRHDIEELNWSYRTIERLEARLDGIPETNSATVLNEIVRIIDQIFARKQFTGREMVNLYQLQRFVDPRLSIERAFAKALDQFTRNPKELKSLANDLPFCTSEELFNQSIQVFFVEQNKIDKVIAAIFDQKRALFQQVKKIKVELIKKRIGTSLYFPPYFDELIDGGAVDLYNHLVEIKGCDAPGERGRRVEAIPFDELSRIVLQVRESIIRTVESAIATSSNRPLLFLLGVTGAGKSTSLSFLRGDSMERVGEDSYESSDQKGIIGHNALESSTFLPHIEFIDDLIVVDYLGFSDTHGPLVALGAECALKWLMKVYRPKILIVHSITDTEGRLKGVADMRLELERLLGADMDSSLLGITKYSHTKIASEIEAIKEKRQKLSHEKNALLQSEQKLHKELEQLRQEVESLQEEMEVLESAFQEFLKDPSQISQQVERFQQIASEREGKQEKLTKQRGQLRAKEKNASQIQPGLKEIENKLEKLQRAETEKNQVLDEREKRLLKHFGLKDKIRFCNLEDRNHRTQCLQKLLTFSLRGTAGSSHSLSAPSQGSAPSLSLYYPHAVSHRDANHSLSASHRQLLVTQLEKLLVEEPSKDRYGEIQGFDDFISFQQSALESSLTKTVFSHSHPEIGQLLHLPEIDPTIVHDFDKKIVERCLNTCIELEVVRLNLDLLSIAKQNYWINNKIKQQIQVCDEKLKKMIKYLVSIINIDSKEEDLEKSWKKIKQKYKDTIDKAKNGELENTQPQAWQWLFPDFRTIEVFVKLGWKPVKEQQILLNDLLSDYSLQIDQGHERLVKLVELERLIDKKEEINKAIQAHPLCLASLSDLIGSVKTRSAQVRALYGVDKWGDRIQFLSDRMRPHFLNLIQSPITKKTSLRNKRTTVTYLKWFDDACPASLILSLNRNLKIACAQIRVSDLLKKVLVNYVESKDSLLTCSSDKALFLIGENVDPKSCVMSATINSMLSETKKYFSGELPDDQVLEKIFADLLIAGLQGEFKSGHREGYMISTGWRQMKEQAVLNSLVEQAAIGKDLKKFLTSQEFVKQFLNDIYYLKYDVEGVVEGPSIGVTSFDKAFGFAIPQRTFKYAFSNGSNHGSRGYLEGFPLWAGFFDLVKELGVDTTMPLSEVLLQEVVWSLWSEVTGGRRYGR